MTLVLDASALIALVRNEPGANEVRELLDGADPASAYAGHISSVNLTEVLQHLGESPSLVSGPVPDVESVPYDTAQAGVAAAMFVPTRAAGLSLADRACLALGKVLGLPVITADRAWSDVDLGVEVIQIR